MEIANLITGFTQQQSNRNAILSDNLAKYGANIGNYLANQEYQRQAQESLPMINDQMQSALKLAGENKPAEAYGKILNLVTQNPNLLNNPYTFPAFQIGLDVAGKTASAAEKMAMYKLQYGPRTVDVVEEGEEVVTPMPSIAEMQDPNYDPLTATTRPRSGGTRGSRGGTRGTLIREARAIDDAVELPQRDFDAPVDEVNIDRQDMPGFGFSLFKNYEPDESNLRDFQRNFIEYDSATPEQKEQYENQNRIPATAADEETFEISSQLFPDILGVKGPKGSPRVTKIQQDLTPGRERSTRDIEIKDPLTKFINDFMEADKVISGDAVLAQVHNQVEGKYNRVTTKRLDQDRDPKFDSYAILIDGNEVPKVATGFDGKVAIDFLRAKEAELKTNKIKLVRKPAAPAESAPAEVDDALAESRKVFGVSAPEKTTAPTATPAKPELDAAKINPDNPFAEAAKKELETQALAKQVGQTMRTQAKEITSVREARDRIKKIDKTISNIKAGKTAALFKDIELAPSFGAQVKELPDFKDSVSKYLFVETLMAEKKKLEAFLASK